MYFVPALYALAVYLALPSSMAALGVAAVAWLYLTFAGSRPRRDQLSRIRLDIAYRTLSVKALAVAGDYDETTYDVHALNTPDTAENSRIRALLRDAAAASDDGWRQAAKRVRRAAKGDQRVLLDSLGGLIIQLKSQPSARVRNSTDHRLSDAVQKFLTEVASSWGIGPKNLRDALRRQGVAPSADLAFA